jgi:hypothetical protein
MQMLIIRNEQMQIFHEQIEKSFTNSVMDHLKQHHAHVLEGIPDEIILKRFIYGLKRAEHYGLTWQNNLIAFVTLLFEIGPDFDTYPAFQEILSDRSLPANGRMEKLLESIDPGKWEEAKEAYAKYAWPEDLQ